MCSIASSKFPTTLTDKIRSRYSVLKSSSVASLISFSISLVLLQPLNSTPALSINSLNFGRKASAIPSCTSSVSMALHTPGLCTLALNDMFSAFSKLADSSINRWHKPLSCFITGIVAFSETNFIRPSPPLGTITSMYWFSFNMYLTPSLSVSSINPTLFSSMPFSFKDSLIRSDKNLFEFMASLPPLNTDVFRDFRQRMAASTVTLGLDS